MADSSIKLSIGELKDVSLQVESIAIQPDFVVIDIEDDSHVPLILERPFLKTVGVLVDMERNVTTLRVGKEKMEFTSKQTNGAPLIKKLNRVNAYVDEVVSLKSCNAHDWVYDG